MLKSTKYNTILYFLSILAFIMAFIIVIPLILAFIYQDGNNIYQAFYYTIIISLITGTILKLPTDPENIYIDLTTAMLLCATGWIIVSLLGALPFMIGIEKSFIDSFFEAVSGFTTTGITVFTGLDLMPKSIIFWRSLMQLLGGLGILTFFLLISTRAQGETWQLFSAESHKINVSRPVPNIFKTVKILWMIYLGFMFLESIILIFLGLSVFDAFTHSFTTLSTGGFSHYDASIAHYANSGYSHYILIEYIITFFMFLGGVNFLLHFRFFTGNYKSIKNNSELKTFIKLILYSTIFITILIIILNTAGNFNAEEIFRKTLFQVTSIITTTGFGTHDINSTFFPAAARQIFLVFMLIGGSVGSTAGGIKVMRLNILGRLFKREIKKIYLPDHAVLPVTLDQGIIDSDEINKLTGLFSFWLVLIVVGGIITSIFSDLDGWQAFSGMFSAMGNIGPFFFSVEKMASLSPIIKMTYIIGMLAGRLEILPIIILFTKKAWEK
ncbi:MULTISPECIES: TrkH family potassium uptake protein [Halanaerobium]|uniref:Trk system potassium uptake protein TrkH n=1 Tax=Halanaerobium kushneri TaxID=56779 RepID=A0A1N6PZQ9_9FIRM|nr:MULTISPECIES: TrkH family potassium uptake protein [Halanaerobium]RCW61112.1 trk system potassium uptake protein TrkH [Halanaerobium sp. ST460_2HS_T2]SIQ09773.1 trk system potassium uptake protein TrkH [Halanaerobium kushneri]